MGYLHIAYVSQLACDWPFTSHSAECLISTRPLCYEANGAMLYCHKGNFVFGSALFFTGVAFEAVCHVSGILLTIVFL